MKNHRFLCSILLTLLTIGCVLPARADDRPNVVLIMVDDLGFSDLGCYGSEIETPNLDRLAKNGIQFSTFYNCGKCETTRATLLSGRYHPEVNLRKLENCMTIAEVMQSAGYSTMMTGKWHLEKEPLDRGFEQYFGHLSGATNFFRGDDTFRLGRKQFQVPAKGFYTTDANTDYAIQFLRQRDKDKPFFLYIAHNAPHYPLQAKQKDYEKYRGNYKELGWDTLRDQRLVRQKEIGVIEDWVEKSSRPENVPAWESLTDEQKDRQDKTMAAYAGMIDCVDQNIGRLLTHLESNGDLDNTLIMFLSDNGACPFQRTKKKTVDENLEPYDADSYWTYDRGWAHACNTPFREYKQNQHEGGIRTPFIMHWPKATKEISASQRIHHQRGHLVDIMATCIDVSGFEYPAEFNGRKIGKLRGVSLRPALSGETRDLQPKLFFSFRGKNNAMLFGKWKIVNKDFGKFELYRLPEDPTESKDLSQQSAQVFQSAVNDLRELFADVGQAIKKKPPNNKDKKSKSE